jgi:RNase P/RNase MRP subunit p30
VLWAQFHKNSTVYARRLINYKRETNYRVSVKQFKTLVIFIIVEILGLVELYNDIFNTNVDVSKYRWKLVLNYVEEIFSENKVQYKDRTGL